MLMQVSSELRPIDQSNPSPLHPRPRFGKTMIDRWPEWARRERKHKREYFVDRVQRMRTKSILGDENDG